MQQLLSSQPAMRSCWRYLACALGVIWLLLLLVLSDRGSSGLWESTHDEWREVFQLPASELDIVWPIPRSLLSGRLEKSTFFDSFVGSSHQRPWIKLSLPAEERNGVDPQQFVGIENLRLFKSDGSLMCALFQRFDLPLRPTFEGQGEGLELAQQLEEYPRRIVRAHTVEIEWSPFYYSQGCRYEQPRWVIADVVHNRLSTVAEPLWLELGVERSAIKVGSSTVSAIPGGLPGEWWIELVNQGRQSMHFVPGAYPSHRGERRVRYPPSGSHDGLWNKAIPSGSFFAADIYRLRFNKVVPAGLSLRLVQSDEERVEGVSFTSEEQSRSSLEQPSPWRIGLPHTELDFPEDLPQQPLAKEFHELYLPISLSAVCQLRVVSVRPRAGQSLRWHPVGRLPNDEYRGYTTLPSEYLDRVRWELQTSDGAQRFFHDLGVQSELLCPSRMDWQAIPYQASPRPWLVDLAQLPTSTISLNRPAREFFGRLRFLDATGQALMPIARTEGLPDPSLSEFVLADKQLKFHGEVVRIESLAILDPTPHRVRWDYNFKAVDVY